MWKLPKLIVCATTLVCLLANLVAAQAPEPQQRQILNGLRILLWLRPGDPEVFLKLRIHSGAAFDTLGKEGTLALLGDMLFPDPATHAYFTEENRGRLDVETNYDSINITLKGRASEYDRIVDFLRAAVVTTQLGQAEVTQARTERIAKLKQASAGPAQVADRAIAERLLGGFPYTRSIDGTPDSLARIERADLMLARDRFLNPNNATLVVVGGVDEPRAMRGIRQLLGGWRKSDQVVPQTFRQPATADQRTFIVPARDGANAEVRLAVRGLARTDRDWPAASVVAALVRLRWGKLQPDIASAASARLDAYALPGALVIGGSVSGKVVAQTLDAARNSMKAVVDTAPSQSELQMAKDAARGVVKLEPIEAAADSWLDRDTYNLSASSQINDSYAAISPADIQRVASRLFNQAIASVVVGNPDEVKAQLAPGHQFEVAGEVKKPEQVAPTKPATQSETPNDAKRRAPVFTIKPKDPIIKTSKPPDKPD